MNKTLKALIMDIAKLKIKLIRHAKKNGISENFGQKELRALGDKYDYATIMDSGEHEKMAMKLEQCHEWAMTFTFAGDR